jgi:transcription initiation factor TFIIIB Brf1 subunit/transcription initiation factor TFIIB
LKCPYCGGEVIYDCDVGYVCTSCGTVIDERPIDPRPPRGKTITCGFTYTLHSKGVGFTAVVNKVDHRIKSDEMGRLGLILRAMFKYYGDYMDDKCIREEASMIAHAVLGQGKPPLKKLSYVDAAGVLVYIASRRCGRSISMKTLPSGIRLLKALRIALKNIPGLRDYYTPSKPTEEALIYVAKAAECLDYENPGEIVKLSREILESIPLPHATPRMLAGVAVYLSLIKLNASPTYRAISNCLGVRDTNLSFAVRKIEKIMKEISVIP